MLVEYGKLKHEKNYHLTLPRESQKLLGLGMLQGPWVACM